MAFTIRNATTAGDPQASPDKVDFDILAQGIAGEGVVSGCAVTAQGSPNMTGAVAGGTVRIGGSVYPVIAGNVTFGTAHATNPRFDLVTINLGNKVVVAGTAAAVPVFPAASVVGTAVVIAAVHIPANDTALGAPQFEDKRVMVGTGFTEALGVALSDETTAITAGVAKAVWRAPFNYTVTAVRASLSTASTAGVVTIDINDGGVSILGTKLTIDVNEKSSATAAAAATITDTTLFDDTELTFDIDTAGTGAKGLKIVIFGVRA